MRYRWSSRLLLAVAVLIHLAMLVGWRWQQPLVPYFFDATVLSGGRGLDFYSIYQAGYNARHGADVYEGDSAQVDIVVPYFTPYRYLPVVAYSVGAALSLFTPLTAYKLWVVLVELTLLACAFGSWRAARDPNVGTRLAAMWLAFSPFYLELFMGQFSLVQAALILGLLLMAMDDVWMGGLWLASVLWKINTIVFAPVFLRQRRWRTLLVTALVVALTTLPYFLVFPAHWRDFWLNNFGNTIAGHELGNLGFRQLVFEMLAALGASAVGQRLAQLLTVGVAAGVALYLTFRPAKANGRWGLAPFHSPLATYLSLWLVAFFLVSPQIWEHHYVMLLPVLVVAYKQKPHWLIALVWLLLALPTPFGFVGLQPVIAANHDLRAFALEPAWRPLLQHASKALPAAALFVYLAAAIRFHVE